MNSGRGGGRQARHRQANKDCSRKNLKPQFEIKEVAGRVGRETLQIRVMLLIPNFHIPLTIQIIMMHRT